MLAHRCGHLVEVSLGRPVRRRLHVECPSAVCLVFELDSSDDVVGGADSVLNLEVFQSDLLLLLVLCRLNVLVVDVDV